MDLGSAIVPVSPRTTVEAVGFIGKDDD